jgi:hypothetical protein
MRRLDRGRWAEVKKRKIRVGTVEMYGKARKKGFGGGGVQI